MAFELPDGKTARTLPEQVKFLTEKLKDLYAAFNELGIKKIEIVESLPETGQEGILYMVPVEDPDTGNYYEEYIWLDSQWEMIGTTQIDLSGYVTTDTDQTITANKTFTGTTKFVNINNNYNQNVFALANNMTWVYRKLVPSPTAELDLGSNTQYWKDAYLSGTIHLGLGSASCNSNGDVSIKSSGAGELIVGPSSTRCANNFLPSYGQDKTLGLNNDNYRWAGLYLKPSAPISDGTNSVTVADLAALITYAKAQGWIS